jgi:hypothetical protein
MAKQQRTSPLVSEQQQQQQQQQSTKMSGMEEPSSPPAAGQQGDLPAFATPRRENRKFMPKGNLPKIGASRGLRGDRPSMPSMPTIGTTTAGKHSKDSGSKDVSNLTNGNSSAERTASADRSGASSRLRGGGHRHHHATTTRSHEDDDSSSRKSSSRDHTAFCTPRRTRPKMGKASGTLVSNMPSLEKLKAQFNDSYATDDSSVPVSRVNASWHDSRTSASSITFHSSITSASYMDLMSVTSASVANASLGEGPMHDASEEDGILYRFINSKTSENATAGVGHHHHNQESQKSLSTASSKLQRSSNKPPKKEAPQRIQRNKTTANEYSKQAALEKSSADSGRSRSLEKQDKDSSHHGRSSRGESLSRRRSSSHHTRSSLSGSLDRNSRSDHIRSSSAHGRKKLPSRSRSANNHDVSIYCTPRRTSRRNFSFDERAARVDISAIDLGGDDSHHNPKKSSSRHRSSSSRKLASSDTDEDEVASKRSLYSESMSLTSGERIVDNKIVTAPTAASAALASGSVASGAAAASGSVASASVSPAAIAAAKEQVLHREPTSIWTCPCGFTPQKRQKFCGMCGNSQHWTCSCGYEENMALFAFCGMCGSAKEVAVAAATATSRAATSSSAAPAAAASAATTSASSSGSASSSSKAQ